MGEIEYLAGFFDGEGSVGIYTNGRGLFHLRTQLTQNVGKHSTRLVDHAFAERVSRLVKALKKTDLDQLLVDDPSLWDLLGKLRVQPSVPDGFFLREHAAPYNRMHSCQR